MNLAELPEHHPLRNAPLAAINAEYRWAGDVKNKPGEWKMINVHHKIANNTYNELGNAWRNCTEWRAVDRRTT